MYVVPEALEVGQQRALLAIGTGRRDDKAASAQMQCTVPYHRRPQ